MVKYLVYRIYDRKGVRIFTKLAPARAFIRRVMLANPRHAKMNIIKLT